MARTAEERAALQAAARRYTGKDFGVGGYDQAFEDNPGISVEARIRELIASPEARNYAQQRAQDLYQPQLSQLGIAETQAGDQYANLLQALEQRQQDLPEQVLGQFNRRGLLRSGLAVEGLGRQQADLGRSITSAQQARAYKLADLAAQRAQLTLKQAGYAQELYDQPFEEIASAEEAARKNTQVVTAGGRTLLIDKGSGRTIADLGSAYKGSGKSKADAEAPEDIVGYVNQLRDFGYSPADIRSYTQNDLGFVPEALETYLSQLADEEAAASQPAPTQASSSSFNLRDFLNKAFGSSRPAPTKTTNVNPLQPQPSNTRIQSLFGLR